MAEEAEINEVPEYTEIEEKAISMGWNPEGVEGKKNLSAEEFVDRQPLYEDIRSLKKAFRQSKDSIEAMKGMLEGVRQQGYEEAIQKLNEQKKRAMEDENYDGVIKIDEQIAQKREEAKADTVIKNPDFEEWIDKNQWYENEGEMHDYADFVGQKYLQKNGKDTPLKEVYQYVSEKVKKQFPDFFDEKPRKNPVEGASRGRSSGASYSARDLNETERSIMKTLIRDGTFKNESEFMKAYKES